MAKRHVDTFTSASGQQQKVWEAYDELMLNQRHRPAYPTVDYGQGNRVWNPGDRSEVYQQINRARKDDDFARQFMTDLLFSKKETGKYFYELERVRTNPSKTYRHEVRDKVHYSSSKEEPVYEDQLMRRPVNYSGGYLYNKNTLNAAKSWVNQAFSNPMIKGADGHWYRAEAFLDRTGSKEGNFGFIQGKQRISDANTLRMLNEGHHAFSAKGANGTTAYVLYADGFVPKKGTAAKPEMGNEKQQTNHSSVQRDMVLPETARPGNVIGGRTTLLGVDSPGQPDRRNTLLGR